MALTQIQKLELNRQVDRIFHASSNTLAKGNQPEIAFVTQMPENREWIESSIKDAVASLKAHDKMFQNMRSNMVYWNRYQITSKVTPMSFILMGKAFEVESQGNNHTETLEIVDNIQNFEHLCAYLKLYHARCRCILVFVDNVYAEWERQNFGIVDMEAAKQHLNPFLKFRLLVITKNCMITGSELMRKMILS